MEMFLCPPRQVDGLWGLFFVLVWGFGVFWLVWVFFLNACKRRGRFSSGSGSKLLFYLKGTILNCWKLQEKD